MKSFILNKKIALTLALSCVVFTYCKKDDVPPKTKFNISATAEGNQEVPTVTTTGTGTVTGTYDSVSNYLTYTVTWTGLSGPATNMHFHSPGLAGTNAGVAIGITGFASAASGTVAGTATLTQTQERDMMEGKWYYNVHTTAHGGGEIRGQVSVK